MAQALVAPQQLTRKDFLSSQEVRWCPGCGDYAILAQMQRVLPDLGTPKEKIVFISGIGCSSRFPYYMETYGVHSIHGRAPTLATGLKVANPDLNVWVITGDGDGLSIGGNHLLHCLRRNVDINILLFNNRIYGLTKGQYSPTSLPGHRTKTSPMGTIEQSFNPLCVAIGAEATFVARTVDRNTKHLAETLRRAAEHKGTSFVEIYQNCNIFNDGAWDHVVNASVRDDHILMLEHGKPMIFGKDRDKGIRFTGLNPEVVALGNGVTEDDLLVHDEKADQPSLAYFLSRMEHPAFPVPLGVFRGIERPTYEAQVLAQEEMAITQKGQGDLDALYRSADTWVVPSMPTPEGEAYETCPVELTERSHDVPTPSPISLEGAKAEPEMYRMLTDAVESIEYLRDPVCVLPDTSLQEAIALMSEKNVGCLLVTDDQGILIGIFVEGDIFYKIGGERCDLPNTPVADLMTTNPTTLNVSAPIGHAMHLMALHGFRHIPIVDDAGKPIKVANFRAGLRFIGDLYAPGAKA